MALNDIKNSKRAEAYQHDLATRQPGHRWISMTNALVRAGHALNLAEKRIIAAAVSKLDSRVFGNPISPPRTKITAQEYAETFGVDINTAYDQLQSAARQLFERKITFYEPAHERKGKPLKPAKTVMRWVGQATYHEGEGWVELHWWPALLPHLTGLRANFTSYQLRQASALRSTYSWRLLELLMHFRKQGWAEYDIDDFATAMDATEKQRTDFAAIRRKIIEPSVKELREKDGWIINWTPVKAGRKVKALRFDFERSPQKDLFNE